MTVRVAVAVAAAAMSLLTCACASRGAGSGGATSGIVDTFTRSGSAVQPSARPSSPPSAPSATGCSRSGNGTGFAFSIAATAKGYPTPREAAVQFSRHNDMSVPAVPPAQWTSTRLADGYGLNSGQVAVHVVHLRNHAWIVDSGTICR